MKDPLEQFLRRTPRVSPAANDDTPTEYQAFGARDRVERLRIRRANDPARSPGYEYLLDVVYDELYGTDFALVYTYMTVLVEGENLLSVVSALQAGTAEYIQEFDSDRWQKPKDSAAPFISSVRIEMPEGAAGDESGRAAN